MFLFFYIHVFISLSHSFSPGIISTPSLFILVLLSSSTDPSCTESYCYNYLQMTVENAYRVLQWIWSETSRDLWRCHFKVSSYSQRNFVPLKCVISSNSLRTNKTKPGTKDWGIEDVQTRYESGFVNLPVYSTRRTKVKIMSILHQLMMAQ